MFSGDELMCDLPSWIDLDMVSQSVYGVNPGDKRNDIEGLAWKNKLVYSNLIVPTNFSIFQLV